MIQKYIEQAKEVIGNVKATEENYTFEESRAEDIDFYSESFWSLVTLIEKATGMALVEDDNFPSPMDDFMERLHETNRQSQSKNND
jgi:hypothetical protein